MSDRFEGNPGLSSLNQRLAALYLLARAAGGVDMGQGAGEGGRDLSMDDERAEDEVGFEHDEVSEEGEEDEEEDDEDEDYEDDQEESGEAEDSEGESRSSLCPICRKINITRTSFDSDEHTENVGWGSHTLGTLEEIHARKSCLICCLVAKAIEEYPSSTGKEGQFRLEWGSDRLNARGSREPQKTFELYIYRGNRMLYEETFKAKGHIVMVGDAPFQARAIGDTVDMSRVRDWLRNCAEWHGEKCSKPLYEKLESPRTLSHFKVIDVQQGCLVTLPPGAKYFALSYCWGAVTSLVAVRDNVHQLEEPHGIFNGSQKIASTIEEAILLTSELDVQYLWVDQLCITQDDPEIKLELINNMDKIYGHANLVIVAASGSDANAGLPGFHGRPRGISQSTAQIESNLEVALLPYPVDTIRGCWYSSRGWTYQEQTLAQRLLVFVGGQVIFKCQCALWREDRHTDGEDRLSTQDSDFFEFEMSFKVLPGRYRGEYSVFSFAEDKDHNVDSEDEGDDVSDEGKSEENAKVQGSASTTIVLYQRAIEEISQRSLSYQTDALNVAAGLLQIIEAKDETKAYFGLPEAYFDSILLWIPGHSKGFNRRHGFPSWSWTGWIGAIGRYMEMQPLDNPKKPLSTWIVWQLVTTEGNLKQLKPVIREEVSDTTDLDTASSENVKPYFNLFDTTSLRRKRADVKLVSATDNGLRPGILRFWTITCKLDVQAQVEVPDFRLAGDQSKAFKFPIMDLVDCHGTFAGRVVLHPERGVPFTVRMEFVVHSQSPTTDEGIHYLGFVSYQKDKELGLGMYALQPMSQRRTPSESDSNEEEDVVGKQEKGGQGAQHASQTEKDMSQLSTAEASTETGRNVEGANADLHDENQDGDVDNEEEEEEEREEESLADYIAQAYPPLKQRKNWKFFNVIAIRRHEDGVAERIGIGKILESAIRESFDGGPLWSEVFLS